MSNRRSQVGLHWFSLSFWSNATNRIDYEQIATDFWRILIDCLALVLQTIIEASNLVDREWRSEFDLHLWLYWRWGCNVHREADSYVAKGCSWMGSKGMLRITAQLYRISYRLQRCWGKAAVRYRFLWDMKCRALRQQNFRPTWRQIDASKQAVQLDRRS